MPASWKKKNNPFSQVIPIFPQFRGLDLGFLRYKMFIFQNLSLDVSNMTSDNEAHISFTFRLGLKTLQENLLKIVTDSKTHSHFKPISKFFSNIEGHQFCVCIHLRVYVNYKDVYACAYVLMYKNGDAMQTD